MMCVFVSGVFAALQEVSDDVAQETQRNMLLLYKQVHIHIPRLLTSAEFVCESENDGGGRWVC